MYPVSDKYKAAIRDSTRKYYYSGKIVTKNGTEYPFENKDIVKGSAYVTNQCCGDSEIEIGSVYAAEMGITLYSNINRYSLEGATITLSFFLLLDDGTYEEVPLGIFEVSEANRTINCLAIKGYDYMLRFEKDFQNLLAFGLPYDFLKMACDTCGVVLAHTEDEIRAWKNGDTNISVYTENDIETWRDVLFYVAQTLGCFCTINRAGELELRKYGSTIVETIESKHRYMSSFSDFVTRYTSVSSTNVMLQKSEYYSLETDDALTMNLGINPLLQFGLEETRKTILLNILSELSFINYVPFDSSTIGNPALDLGDVISFSSGYADSEQISCITKYEYKINGKHTIKCVGKNPRLSKAKSKTDKNISELLNSVETTKMVIHSFTNAQPYILGSADASVVSVEFSVIDDTDAQFHAAILLNVSADAVEKTGTASGVVLVGEEEYETQLSVSLSDDGLALLSATYILNDNVLSTYVPMQSLHSGKHIINLYYPLSGLKANSYNTFEVRLRIEGGSASIGRTQAIATISGQGLSAAEVWDGKIEIEEMIDTVNIANDFIPVNMDESLSIKTLAVTESGITQDFSLVSFGAFGVWDLKDYVVVDEVVETEILETADRKDLTFNEKYVDSIDTFTFKRDYSFAGREQEIDEGRMSVVSIDTEQFGRVDSLEVQLNGQL